MISRKRLFIQKPVCHGNRGAEKRREGERIPQGFPRKVVPPPAKWFNTWGQMIFELISRESCRLGADSISTGSWVSCPAAILLGCLDTATIPWEQRFPAGKFKFFTANKTLLPARLITALAAGGETRKQQRDSAAADQKFLPSSEVSVYFLLLFWKGKKKPKPQTRSPREGHKTQELLFFFPAL